MATLTLEELAEILAPGQPIAGLDLGTKTIGLSVSDLGRRLAGIGGDQAPRDDQHDADQRREGQRLAVDPPPEQRGPAERGVFDRNQHLRLGG